MTHYMIDVQDTVQLYVAAMIDPEVKNERIFALSEAFTWK